MPLPEEIGGIIIGPLVAAIIEALKAFGFPVRYAPYLNLGLSIAFWLLATAFGALPEYQSWIVAALQILIIVLTAAGFYEEGIKRVTKQRFNN